VKLLEYRGVDMYGLGKLWEMQAVIDRWAQEVAKTLKERRIGFSRG